jgi:hypothetical protein
VAGGDRDRKRSDEQTRPWNDPAVDRLAQIDVREPRTLRVHVAQRRKPGLELLACGGDPLNRAERLSLVHDRRRPYFVFRLQ